MNIRTFTGPSIHEALREARRVLGDDVVLLESMAPQGPEPARITVMADVPERTPAATPAPRYGYPRRTPATVAEKPAVAHAAMPAANGVPTPRPRRIRPLHEVLREEQQPPRTSSPVPPATAVPQDQIQGLVQTIARLVEKQMAPLQRQIESLQKQLRELPDAVAGQWATSRFYRTLQERGLRPVTLNRIFNTLSEKGLSPESSPEAIRMEILDVIHEMLDIPTPRVQAGTLVFLGTSGSGKTSLIAKLASHPGFFARRKCLVLSLVPENETDPFYATHESLFKKLNIPFLTIGTEREMQLILQESTKFDHIFIDTPPVNLLQKDGHRRLWRIKQFLEPVIPLEIHLVMNCTCTLEDYGPDVLNRLPINIDGLALTHMDETPSWGRIVEWMLRMKRPVRFASMGLAIPESVVPFSATWFTEELIDL